MTIDEVRQGSVEKLRDAAVLLRHGRYDAATYLAGYAVELALKARICMLHEWDEFPEAVKDFTQYNQQLKSHDLRLLIKWTARESVVTSAEVSPDWNRVLKWSPEARYKLAGSASKDSARLMFSSARKIASAMLRP